MRSRYMIGAVVGMILALAALVTVAKPKATDITINAGPSSEIQTLYRSFDDGAYEAETVSLAPYDEDTGAALVIDTVHHEVHEGEMFHASYTNGSVGNGNSVDINLKTGASKDAHLAFEVFAGGQVTVYLYESPTYTTTGTALTEYNMKRESAITATTEISHTPTVSVTGSVALVNGRILPGGTSPQTRVGGGIRSNAEWILKPGTEYLMRITNTSGGSIAINWAAEWYEED